MSGFHYLATGTDAKTVKGEKYGWQTFILYLAPHTVSIPFGGRNVCPFASNGCAAACLFTSGHGKFKTVRDARIRKTVDFFKDKESFLAKLSEDIERAVKLSSKKKMKPCFRLNGTSDINWGPLIVKNFPDLQFYDYSKNPGALLNNDLSNYHITFSRSETNEQEGLLLMEQGHNVAVVFPSAVFPERWNGVPVVNGDESDLRFLDPKGCVVGLKAKGDAKKDATGFVVRDEPVVKPIPVIESTYISAGYAVPFPA